MARSEWLPIDPDVDANEDARHHPGAEHLPLPPWPTFRLDVIAAVFVGGCLGGLLRYAVTEHWQTTTRAFPWPTFTVNVAGAFALAVLVVVVARVLPGSRLVRPLLGAGFCGALTTFSSIVVTVDRLAAHGHAGLAAVYLGATLVAGFVAGAVGVVVGRAVTA